MIPVLAIAGVNVYAAMCGVTFALVGELFEDLRATDTVSAWACLLWPIVLPPTLVFLAARWRRRRRDRVRLPKAWAVRS
jgi:hypothetical protein